MTQLYPFRTAYMRENFHNIIAACEEAAYNEDRFADTILPAIITGLAACDGAADDGMTLNDIYDAALNLHIDPDNTAVTESFALGAAIALHQPMHQAVLWAAPEEADYTRIAIHRSANEDAPVTATEAMDMPALDAVLALIDSYIVTPPTPKGPSDAHPATQ